MRMKAVGSAHWVEMIFYFIIAEDTIRYYPSLVQSATSDAPKFVNVPPCNKNKLR